MLRQVRPAVRVVTSGRDPYAWEVDVSDLIALVERHYQLNDYPYAKVFPSQMRRLVETLGSHPACALTATEIERYKSTRLQAVARETVNKELRGLSRGYRLAMDLGELERAPRIAYLRPGRPRSGFLYPGEFRRVATELAPDVRDVAEFGYWSGWRLGEILELRWCCVRSGWAWCYSKNGDEKRAPVLGHVERVIRRRRELGRTGHVFHRRGRPIRSLRKGWNAACRRAGLEGIVFHDMRRSFCRNAIRAGIDRDTVKRLSGHRSDSVFSRYNIQDERDLEDAARRLFLLQDAE